MVLKNGITTACSCPRDQQHRRCQPYCLLAVLDNEEAIHKATFNSIAFHNTCQSPGADQCTQCSDVVARAGQRCVSAVIPLCVRDTQCSWWKAAPQHNVQCNRWSTARPTQPELSLLLPRRGDPSHQQLHANHCQRRPQ